MTYLSHMAVQLSHVIYVIELVVNQTQTQSYLQKLSGKKFKIMNQFEKATICSWTIQEQKISEFGKEINHCKLLAQLHC